MSKKKLTLSVEDRLTQRAKAIAEKRGTSVSRLVETFFAALEDGADVERAAEREGSDEAGRATSVGDSPDEQELSGWARKWRGAFKEPGRSYPDDPDWETKLLAEEIGKKHA